MMNFVNIRMCLLDLNNVSVAVKDQPLRYKIDGLIFSYNSLEV